MFCVQDLINNYTVLVSVFCFIMKIKMITVNIHTSITNLQYTQAKGSIGPLVTVLVHLRAAKRLNAAGVSQGATRGLNQLPQYHQHHDDHVHLLGMK